MWACLFVTGTHLPMVVAFVGFTVERLLTLLGLTPGGVGVVEVGLVGVLLPLTQNPASVVSGVLLDRALTFGLEIPTGAIGIVGWLWSLRRSSAPSSTAAAV